MIHDLVMLNVKGSISCASETLICKIFSFHKSLAKNKPLLRKAWSPWPSCLVRGDGSTTWINRKVEALNLGSAFQKKKATRLKSWSIILLKLFKTQNRRRYKGLNFQVECIKERRGNSKHRSQVVLVTNVHFKLYKIRAVAEKLINEKRDN